MSLNTVSVFMAKDLSKIEFERSINVIDRILPETLFHFSFYQTQEEDLLEYFLQLPEKYFSRIHIHVIKSKNEFNYVTSDVLFFLETLGVVIIEHDFPLNSEHLANRRTFEKFIFDMVKKSDEIIVFTNGTKSQLAKLSIPISIAQKLNKKPYICKNNIGNEIETVY
jgi:hypothetical protein